MKECLTPNRSWATFWTESERAAASWLCGALVLLSIFAVGCNRKPAALVQKALAAETAAKLAFEQHKPEAANESAVQAEETLSDFEDLDKKGKVSRPHEQQMLPEIKAAAGSARNYAELAREEQQRRERLNTIKLQAYQRLRSTVAGYGLAGLTPIIDRLARADTNSLSAPEQALASVAWRLVELTGRHSDSTNATDWAGVASDLHSWSNSPPAPVGLFLAVVFAVHGFTDFALCELESVDASRLSGTNALSLYHLERSALFAWNGWDRSAAREMDELLRISGNQWKGPGITQAVSVLQCWLAGHAIRVKDPRQIEPQLTKAAAIWPDNPLIPLLRADQMAADGQWSEAADYLERRASDMNNDWSGKILVQRAKQLRDGKGSAPLLVKDQTVFMDIFLRALSDSALDSSVLQKLRQFLADAKTFGERLAEKLPGGG